MSKRSPIKGLDAVLKGLGFVRRKETWNRASGGFIDVINIQRHSATFAVAINAGVLDPFAYRLCWHGPVPDFVNEADCTVRVRAGRLLNGRDTWWDKGAPNLTEELVASVRAEIIPFLERMHSEEAMASFLGGKPIPKSPYPPPYIYLAALKWKIGHRDEALAILDDLERKTHGPWQADMPRTKESLIRSD